MEKALQILRRLDKLEKYYWDEIAAGNFKAAGGLESCVSLRMKLFGLDGKEPYPTPANPAHHCTTLNLNALSDTSLSEIEALMANTHNPTTKKSEPDTNTPIYLDPFTE